MGYGILMIIIGLGLEFWYKRRRFNRMNSHGVQEYKNFASKTASDILEGLVQIIKWTLLLVGLGICVYFFSH